MPNLKAWIEAQLKRGYTRELIKKDLIRKGYPSRAVAEVDKTNVRKEKKLGMAVLVLLFAVIAISLVFMLKQKDMPKQQDLVQQILQDEKIIDPQHMYKGFDTALLVAHSISGRVVGVNQSMIRLRVNESIITIPRPYSNRDFPVIYLQVANGTRTVTPPRAIGIGVGDRIRVGMYTDAVTSKTVGITITTLSKNKK